MAGMFGRMVEEQMRRVAARSTEEVARRLGGHFGIYLGCGYPKSGTVWLCQMMGHYLGLPYPQNYAMPIMMASVVHAHWEYDARFPPTAYIRRDGRDVLVSMYFYEMRALQQPRNPRSVAARRGRFDGLFGRSYDPADVARNLPRFIEDEMTRPQVLRGVTWQAHVEDWCGTPRPNVSPVDYEDLLERPQETFGELMASVTGEPADEARVRLAVDRFEFRRSGRESGEEDRQSFMRKGVRGDWRNHFTREAGEVFEAHAGDALRAFGYETDPRWVEAL